MFNDLIFGNIKSCTISIIAQTQIQSYSWLSHEKIEVTLHYLQKTLWQNIKFYVNVIYSALIKTCTSLAKLVLY